MSDGNISEDSIADVIININNNPQNNNPQNRDKVKNELTIMITTYLKSR